MCPSPASPTSPFRAGSRPGSRSPICEDPNGPISSRGPRCQEYLPQNRAVDRSLDTDANIITGTGRRRRWDAETKARLVAESFEPGRGVSEVARCHDISPSLNTPHESEPTYGLINIVILMTIGSHRSLAQNAPAKPIIQDQPKKWQV